MQKFFGCAIIYIVSKLPFETKIQFKNLLKSQLEKAISGLILALTILLFPANVLGRDLSFDIPSLVQVVNEDRTANNLPELRRNAALDFAASLKAADMVKNGYFSHTSPEGIDPWFWFEQAGYDYTYAGENLALDFDNADTVEQAWMASPKHRANILNGAFEEVGYAIAAGTFTNINGVQGKRTGTIIVQLFGKAPQKVQLASAKALSIQIPEGLTLITKEMVKPLTLANSSPVPESEPVNVLPLLSFALVVLLIHEQSKIELI